MHQLLIMLLCSDRQCLRSSVSILREAQEYLLGCTLYHRSWRWRVPFWSTSTCRLRIAAQEATIFGFIGVAVPQQQASISMVHTRTKTAWYFKGHVPFQRHLQSLVNPHCRVTEKGPGELEPEPKIMFRLSIPKCNVSHVVFVAHQCLGQCSLIKEPELVIVSEPYYWSLSNARGKWQWPGYYLGGSDGQAGIYTRSSIQGNMYL